MTMLGAAVLFAVLAPQEGREVTLAVGPGGQRMIAADGLSWGDHVAWGEPKHDQNDLNVAAFFKGAAYVGGGYSIARLTATRDGKAWSEGALPKGGPVFGLEELDGLLYAVTLRGVVFRTADGETWEEVAAARMPGDKHWIRSTRTGNGLLVGSGDFGPVIAYDPRTGKLSLSQMAGQSEKHAGIQRVAFGNGTFVVAGQDGLLAASKDGVSWTNNETKPERGMIHAVIWTGDRFLASAQKGALVSPDGIEWTPSAQPVPRKFARAGDWIYGWSWPPHKLQRSRDGTAWEPVPNEKEYHVKDVASGRLDGSGAPPRLPARK
jgi:hypothetical protein